MPLPHSSRIPYMRLGLAAILAATTWVSKPLPALAAGEAPWWSRIEQLNERQAYPAVESELRRAMADPGFRGQWDDRAAYMIGLAQRRLGKPQEAFVTLKRVGPESSYHLRALAERAAIKRQLGEDTQAIALFEQLLTESPDASRDDARSPLADLYFTTGQYAKALAQYRTLANALGPHRERALFGWGWALVRVNEEAAAINVWKQALERFPTSRFAQAVRLAMGNLLLARGEHLAASTYYNEAARQGKDEALMARAELLAGEAYADSKEYGLAISHYRAVPADSPLQEPAFYGEIWCTWQEGRFDEARRLVVAFLDRWPQSTYRGAAYYALGAIEAASGKPEAAEAAWHHALAVAPRSSWAEEAQYRLAKQAFETNDHAAALAIGRRLLEAHPRSRFLGPVLWMRGESLLAQAQYSEAVKAFSQLAVSGQHAFLAGQGAEVDFKIGMAHFYGGQYAEAARVLDAVVSGPLAASAAFWQAEARYRLGQYEQARALYSRLIDRHRDFPRMGEAFYGLGWASHRLGDHAGAKAAYQQAANKLEDGRTRQDAFYRWGLALIDLHEWENARFIFGQLLEKRPDPAIAADARFQMAWSLYRQGKLEEAATGFGNFALGHASNQLAPQALVWQGRSYFRLDRFEDAVRVLQGAIAHPLATSGQIYEAREQLAAAYHNAGRYEDSRQVYEQLMQMADLPADRVEDLRDGVIQSHMKAGNYRQARREVLKRNPLGETDRKTLQSIAEAFLARGEWTDVIETWLAVPQPGPTLTFWAGKAHLEKQTPAEAIKLLEPLRETRDEELRPQVLYELARAYRAKGDMAVARDTLIQLSESYMTKPVAAIALLEAAQVASEQRDFQGAQNLYRRVAENRNFHADRRRQAWMGLGDLHRGQKQWGPALLAYRGARGLGPVGSLGMALGGFWAGSVLVEMRQYKEAIKELESLQFPKDAEPLPSLAALKRGEALERLNRWREAMDVYGKLAAAAPAAERDEARTRLQWIEKNVPKEMR